MKPAIPYEIIHEPLAPIKMKNFEIHTVTSIIIIIASIIQFSCSSKTEYYDDSRLLYVSKNNSNLVIVSKEVNSPYTGAWDGENLPPHYFIQNLNSNEISRIELSEVNEYDWIRIKIDKLSKSVGWKTPYLGRDYVKKTLANAETSNSIQYNKLHFDYSHADNKEYPVINGYYSVAGIQECHERFKTFIIAVQSKGLILTNVDSLYNHIHSLGIAGISKKEDYLYIKSSDFTSPCEFELTEDYYVFANYSSDTIDSNSDIQVRFMTKFTIQNNGEIAKTSKESFGKIEVITGANTQDSKWLGM